MHNMQVFWSEEVFFVYYMWRKMNPGLTALRCPATRSSDIPKIRCPSSSYVFHSIPRPSPRPPHLASAPPTKVNNPFCWHRTLLGVLPRNVGVWDSRPRTRLPRRWRMLQATIHRGRCRPGVRYGIAIHSHLVPHLPPPRGLNPVLYPASPSSPATTHDRSLCLMVGPVSRRCGFLVQHGSPRRLEALTVE
jgi:hypothetical protein